MSQASSPLSQLWRSLVTCEPSAPAVLGAGCGGQVVTRRMLEEGALRRLGGLAPGSLSPGMRVGLALPNGPAWLEVFLGLTALGAVPVLLDQGEPGERLVQQARRLGASWLWCEEGMLQLGSARRARDKGAYLVKVTSGSTGEPRALRFNEAQMRADGLQICRTMGVLPEDRNLAIIPLGHSYGLGNLVMPLLLQGTAVVCHDSPLPGSIAEVVRACAPTVFPAVPTLLRAWMRSDLSASELASLRLVISAGSVLSAEEASGFEARFGLRVHNFYGSSETGGICYDRTGESTLLGTSVGTPLDGVRLELGKRGRFRVFSAAVMGRGSHAPKDQGCLLPDGSLRLLGRVGRQTKVGAKRIDLGGLERELCQVSGVRGAVVGVYSKRNDVLAALVASDLEATELRRRMLGSLAAWRVPGRILVVAELPHTARGKIDRKQALALVEARAD